MEPLTFFAATVIIVGVFHLLSSAVNAISRNKYATDTHSPAKRNDWYCFFSLKDLVGMDKSVTTNNGHQELPKDDIIIQQKRRQQAQRPRLQA